MDLQDPAVVCSLLDLSPILTGQQPVGAAETVRRQRKVLVSAVQYGIERGVF